MSAFGLEAMEREQTGKGVARRLRSGGMVPAVMYGVGDPRPLAVPHKEMLRLLRSEGGDHALIELKVGGKKTGVILRDYQLDPVTGDLIHCDFQEVQKGHRLTVTVGIVVVGETPVGVREQGILQHQMHEIELDCLPDRIPERLEVDASPLRIGDSIHVADLKLPEGVRFHASPDATVVSVLPPKLAAEEEAAPAPAEVPAAAAPEAPAAE
jgi:large subunit ribosomal protein L25